MNKLLDLDDIKWDRYPALASEPLARKWLECQVLIGLYRNTIEAYARGVQQFIEYCNRIGGCVQEAKIMLFKDMLAMPEDLLPSRKSL